MVAVGSRKAHKRNLNMTENTFAEVLWFRQADLTPAELIGFITTAESQELSIFANLSINLLCIRI